MNYDRINELEKFAEEFNSKLEDAYKNHEENLEHEKILKKENANKKPVKEKKKKNFSENIFKDPPSWKYNCYTGSQFEGVKLNPREDLNGWQINRINLLKRTFAKEHELPQHKDFRYTKSFGKEFGEEKNLNSLSELGRSIVSKFMKENEMKETTLKQKEEDIYKFKHSKPPLQLNSWKSSNHQIEEFSKTPVDKVHAFKKEPKVKYLIQEPFKRTKRDGNYFENEVKLI